MIQTLKQRLRQRHDERGFTLIELLVVIAIIAILAALILVALNAAQQGSRDSKRQSNANQIKTAMATYYSANGDYPTGTIDQICNELQTDGAISSCELLTEPDSNWFVNNSSSTNFNICVQSERNKSEAFGINPTISKKVKSGSSAEFASGNCNVS